MSKAERLFTGWAGMAPDVARDDMERDQVWMMRDWIPRDLGSRLESRSPWAYSTNGPLDGPVRTQKWVSTFGVNHHLAVTPNSLYNLDTPNAPRNVVGLASGGENPLASLWEYVCVPRIGDQLPVFVKYTLGSALETVLTTHASTPKAKFAEAWNAYFVLANTDQYRGRLFWLEPGFPLTGSTTPAWDTKAWWDTTNDITALARTRTSLLAFHSNGVERLRGGIPPGTNRQTDLWMEPLTGMNVGCTHPQTVCYWNDNVLFCDGRGAYLTDGTQVKSLTQALISRAWQTRYTATMRLAAGIVNDFWVVAATEADGSFVDCWVCYLPTRKWFQFTNVPVSSFVTAVDTREHLYGGTPTGKVIDATRIWDESDPLTDNVDGNGVPVLPLLETGFYPLSNGNASRKRVKNALISYDLDEDAGGLSAYFCEQVQPNTRNPWILMRSMRMTDLDTVLALRDSRDQVLRRLPIGREAFGFSFKLEATGTLRNLKLHGFGVEAPSPREDSYA